MEQNSKKALTAVLIVLGILGIIALTWFAAMNYKANSGEEEVSENKTETTSTEETKIINGVPTIEPGKVTEVKTGETSKTSSPGQELISLYYNNLAEGNYQAAYDMKKYKKMDFSVFKSWYTNLKSTKFLDFIEVAPNQYDFLVELTNKDDSIEKYRVLMQVEGNLLNTISSTSTNESPALRFVYGEDGATTTLFLVENGKKTIIDTVKKYQKDETKNEGFNNVEIIPGGEYLIYWKSGWETATGKVYDIKQKKVVHDIDDQRGLYGFTYDMKHFYNCSVSGMLSGDLSVLSVPSFEPEKDLNQPGTLMFGCDGYNKNTNILKYTLSTNGFDIQHPYSYNFDTGEVKSL